MCTALLPPGGNPIAVNTYIIIITFNVFTNDLCSAVKYSNCLLFADDFKIIRETKSPYDSQKEGSIVVYFNYTKLNFNNTTVFSFCRKTN